MTNIFIEPHFRGEDTGDGGIRQVVTAMRRWLPSFGYTIVDRMEDADLVHTHAGHVLDVPVNVPWVVSCHGLYWQEYNWPQWAQKLNQQVIEAMRRADHVTAPSEWVAQALRRGMLLSPTILYHGVDPAEWDGGVNEGYILWNKTRVDPVCDPAPLNALAPLAPDLEFVTTFGDAFPNLEVTGTLPYTQAREVVKGAGVYLATTRETFGIGTLEALAAGVPVVGWDWGGQREIVQHGVTGWLAPVGDIPGLLTGIRWAIANRTAISEAARADVLARWTWAHAIGRYADLYRELLAKEKRQQQAPRVSVVVPCYNLAQYLPDALRSLQAQTAPDWEAIVVDDASPDDTGAVVAEFAAADKRIRYYRNDKNLYLAGTLNAGAELARGRYLLNLDADNMLAPGALATLANAMDADRGLGIAYGAVQFVQEDGRTPDSTVGPLGRSTWPYDFEFRNQITGRNSIPSTALLRRSVWERTGGWRRRWRTAEDADFWTRATSYGAVPRKVTAAITLIYRQRDDSMSRVQHKLDWTAWYPWSRSQVLTPFGVAADPPAKFGLSWPVSSAEPVRVSVIIPVGPGHEHLVVDALDSVDAQTFRAWECVVVNDTGAPLPYVPPWAKVLARDGLTGMGPAYARNLGLKHSSAPLMLFLDADDYLQPDALETMVAVSKERGGVVYSSWYDDFGDGNTARIYEPPEYDAHLLTRKGCIHAVTALYPRAALSQVGGFDEALSHWEDWDLQLALAAAGVCGTRVNQPLWTYRKALGQRREANAAAFDAGKQAILSKWGRFWEGKEELMACRSCPGGGGGGGARPSSGGGAAAMMSNGPQAPDGSEGLVLLEFMGQSPSKVTFRGKVTGTAYTFANIDSARRRYVHPADVDAFVAIKGQFRRVEAGAVSAPPAPGQLVAPGAPRPVQQAVAPARPAAPAPRPAPVVAPPVIEDNDLSAKMAAQLQREAAANGTPVPARRGSTAPVVPPAPMSDAEAVAAVKAVADGLSYMEIRNSVGTWDREQIAIMLSKERASAAPRDGVIKLLETAALTAKEPEAVSLA